jgi:hypothetical protein
MLCYRVVEGASARDGGDATLRPDRRAAVVVAAFPLRAKRAR